MTQDIPRLMVAGHIISGIAYLFLTIGFFLLLPYLITGEDGYVLFLIPMAVSILSGLIIFIVAQLLFLFVKRIEHLVRKKMLFGTFVNLLAILVFIGMVLLIITDGIMGMIGHINYNFRVVIFISSYISIPLIMGIGTYIQTAHFWSRAESKKIKGNWIYSTVAMIATIIAFIFLGIFLIIALQDPGRDLPLEREDSFYRAYLGIYFMGMMMSFFITACTQFSLGRNIAKGEIDVSEDEED